MKIKIAIAFKGTFKSIEAEAVTIWGIPFGIHRTPGRSGWSVTHPYTGLALQSGAATREKARQSVEDSIGAYGNEKVSALLAARPQAPPVNTLEPYTEPVLEATVKPDLTRIVDLIAETCGGLDSRERVAVLRALNSRTGQLKAKSPSAFGDSDERLAAAAWQGLQPNGYKLGMVTIFAIGHHADSQALWSKLTRFQWPAAFDKDKAALVAAGVW
jgi:hypothetical protein